MGEPSLVQAKPSRSWSISGVMTYMPFFYYYIGPMAFLSYLMSGRSLLGRFSYWGWFFGLSFTAYALLLLSTNGLADGMYVIRFCWGFLLFYLVFKSGIQIQVDKLLIFLSILTIIEAVLVNTVIPAELLPNYPIAGTPGHYAEIGGYQRPYSFGASASVTSVILAALLTVSKFGWRGKSLVFVAILTCMSGSGFLALFIYFFARTARIGYLLLVPAIVGIIYYGLALGLDHISLEYLSFLFDFKMGQIMDQISMNSLFIGVPLRGGVDGLGGDFAFLTFIQFNGLVGVLLFLMFLVVNTNKKNRLPLLIMVTGSLHYGTIFFLPGQLMFGYFLNLKSEAIQVSVSNKEVC